MNHAAHREVTERESMAVAEASRQREWASPSFLRELFLGNLRLDLIHPYPLAGQERTEFRTFLNEFERFLRAEVDPAELDTTGEYPPRVLDRLRELGAFGMKIPKAYGGLGFTNAEYQRVMKMLGSYDGNLAALLSAHQSIGVPQPLKLFGSDELKQKYLPRCARGEISAFALTEPDVGSDPARLSTTAERTADGSAYLLNGTKLWCTNGTLADLLVVMARDPETRKISAFVVETAWEGVKVERRCRFMGLRALANAVIGFDHVRVPAENLIGEAGRGLKIALTTLNAGRLMIPNAAVGMSKMALQICRTWAGERVQWGRPVGRHEAIGHKIAEMAAHTFAMEAVADLTTAMADHGRFDIRLEAAAAKEWNTSRGWQIVDDAMQIRGGRGYETESSLAARGEIPIGVERMMRDFRINRIFEGSSEIMHLFMAREALDKHLQVAGALIDLNKGLAEKLVTFLRTVPFYAIWYPTRWLGWGHWPRHAEFGTLARYVRLVERMSRRLARQVFHGMIVYPTRLQNKQAFLFRLVDIANELFAMTASVARARAVRAAGLAEAAEAERLSDLFCRISRRRLKDLFRDLWSNDDVVKYRAGVEVLEGSFSWLEEDVLSHQAASPAEAPSEREAEPVSV